MVLSGEIAGVPYGCPLQFGPILGFVVSAGDSGNAVHDPQEKPVMKTNRSITRTLGLLALILFAAATAPDDAALSARTLAQGAETLEALKEALGRFHPRTVLALHCRLDCNGVLNWVWEKD
jgi:hypothetical protein